MSIFLRFRLFLIKLTRYEFWPYWLFYLPMYFYGVILAIRSGSATYYTAANPCLKYGGAFDMLKFDILEKIHPDYLPKGVLINAGEGESGIMKTMGKVDLSFPLVVKPNIGERGRDVELIYSIKELTGYLEDRTGKFILQEYVDFPLELGILYCRLPDGSKEEITSVMIRDFLRIRGDGNHTLKELLDRNTRALFRRKYLYNKYNSKLDEIIAEGEEIIVEPIGNHNRGTCFLNGNHLINDGLLKVVSGILSPLDGFDYGRLDLKTKSIESLYLGRDIRILELNGINSEPAHIYDPGYKLFRAYKDIAQHMKIIYRISRINYRNGVERAPFRVFVRDLRNHLFPRKNRPI